MKQPYGKVNEPLFFLILSSFINSFFYKVYVENTTNSIELFLIFI